MKVNKKILILLSPLILMYLIFSFVAMDLLLLFKAGAEGVRLLYIFSSVLLYSSIWMYIYLETDINLIKWWNEDE